MFNIPYNKPFIAGKEFEYIQSAIKNRHLSGNGTFTHLCQDYFKKKYQLKKCLLTSSCTDALEMCAILLDIKPGDEIIIPSFTFVSTANAFILRGAKIILADSASSHPNIDENKLEQLITKKTKAIVVVHYAGIACNMEAIISIAHKYNLFVIEDAAQAIDSFYINKKGERQALGSMGTLATFSFHESKNIHCGEGGLLIINDENFLERAEIIWEKGTNRAAFFRGDIDKYNWVDIGSSFLPSEITAAFLFAQLESLQSIQDERQEKWKFYYQSLTSLQQEGKVELPYIPHYATVNAHIFYLVCNNLNQRNRLINFLKDNNVQSMFHYPSLHTSPFYKNAYNNIQSLKNAEHFSDCLLRLPLFVELTHEEITYIINLIYQFFTKN